MALVVRDVHEHELDSILALNNGAGRSIAPLDMATLRGLFERACHFRLAELDGQIAGFLIALRESDDEASPRFATLRRLYPAFVFIDRVVVAPPYRRHGLGRVFYAAVTSYAEARVPVLTCEVRLEPRDDVAFLFHGSRGFQEVDQRVLATGQRVAVLAKPLDCYAFIRKTWLEGATHGLPDVPWLAERERPQPPAELRGTGT
jgi:predicted GNAT superfamily acetyltransferase